MNGNNMSNSWTEPFIRRSGRQNHTNGISNDRYPPQRAFLLSPSRRNFNDNRMNGENDEEGRQQQENDNFESDATEERAYRNICESGDSDVLCILIEYLGQPFVTRLKFWCRTIPVSFLLGILIGGISVGFLIMHEIVLSLWFHTRNESMDDYDKNTNARGEEEDMAHFFQRKGKWNWLIVTTVGGLLSGCILLSSRNGKCWNSIPFLSLNGESQRGDVRHALLYALSSFVALVSGSPLGT